MDTTVALHDIRVLVIAGERDRFVVATKFSLNMRPGDPNAGGNHRKSVVQSLEASLERLGTDYVDLYWLHQWDFTTRVEEIMRMQGVDQKSALKQAAPRPGPPAHKPLCLS